MTTPTTTRPLPSCCWREDCHHLPTLMDEYGRPLCGVCAQEWQHAGGQALPIDAPNMTRATFTYKLDGQEPQQIQVPIPVATIRLDKLEMMGDVMATRFWRWTDLPIKSVMRWQFP